MQTVIPAGGLGMLLALAVVATASAAPDPRKAEPTSWEATLAGPGEPGDPFEMSGIVRAANGDALANTKVFFYHADAKGRYALSKDDPLRLAAVVRTDAKGRYRIRSVFPGTYGYPAHVHFEIMNKAHFMGFLNVRQEGHEAPGPRLSVPVKRDPDGVWRLNRDLWADMGMNSATPPLLSTPELRYPAKAAGDSAR